MVMLRKRLTVTGKERASLQPSPAVNTQDTGDLVDLRWDNNLRYTLPYTLIPRRKTFCAAARQQRSTSLNMDANTERASSQMFTRKHKKHKKCHVQWLLHWGSENFLCWSNKSHSNNRLNMEQHVVGFQIIWPVSTVWSNIWIKQRLHSADSLMM